MKRISVIAMVVVVALSAGAGCSSGSTGTIGSYASAVTVACTQKADADDGDDCAHHPGKTRKLDCDSDQTAEALRAGCEREDSKSTDVCCPTTVAGTKTSSGSSGSTASSCDLKSESWATECSKGCGDVMNCQSFCSGCSPKCYLPCETSEDCERVGAGACEISAKAQNRCSKPPSKCPS